MKEENKDGKVLLAQANYISYFYKRVKRMEEILEQVQERNYAHLQNRSNYDIKCVSIA